MYLVVQDLSGFIGKKISIMLPGGPKGIIKIKGVLKDVNTEVGFITVETEGGIMGGKKTLTVFSLYTLLGLEL